MSMMVSIDEKSKISQALYRLMCDSALVNGHTSFPGTLNPMLVFGRPLDSFNVTNGAQDT